VWKGLVTVPLAAAPTRVPLVAPVASVQRKVMATHGRWRRNASAVTRTSAASGSGKHKKPTLARRVAHGARMMQHGVLTAETPAPS